MRSLFFPEIGLQICEPVVELAPDNGIGVWRALGTEVQSPLIIAQPALLWGTAPGATADSAGTGNFKSGAAKINFAVFPLKAALRNTDWLQAAITVSAAPDHGEIPMFFAATTPALRRNSYAVAPRHFDRALERFLDSTFNPHTGTSANFSQDDTRYTLTLDVPGVAKSQLTIGIEDNQVRIETVADAPRQYKAAYELPQDIDAAASQAKLEDGVLTLTLVKKVPVSKVTQIAIN
jgi:HSP20 family protein